MLKKLAIEYIRYCLINRAPKLNVKMKINIF